MYDISASRLVSVNIVFAKGGFGSTLEFKHEDFSADSTPVRISGGGIVQTQIDMEGELVPKRQMSPVRAELSPIPNTDTDLQLKTAILDARNNPSDGQSPVLISMMKITYGEEARNTITLEGGYPVDGGIGIDVNPEGRFSSQTYVFEFAKIEGKLPTAAKWADYEAEKEESKKQQQQQRQKKAKANPKHRQRTFWFGSTDNQFYNYPRSW